MADQMRFLGEGSAAKPRVVLNWGLGVDSTVILHRYLTDPSSRDFDLKDLTVLTAQVGDEHESTRALVECHMLPLMRKAGVRFVEVARSGPKVEHGLTVLQDTTNPQRCHIEGKYRLSDELMAAGTVPTFSGKKGRLCTLKSKGAVMDAWLEKDLRGDCFRSQIGFNADEMKRVERDRSFTSTQRIAEHPLVAWGMGRAACEAYLKDVFGEPWLKSACVMCPFAGGKKAALERLAAEPAGAGRALLVERVALSLNRRMTLFKGRSLAGCFGEEHNEEVLAALEAELDRLPWALYRVRRYYRGKGDADRDTMILERGARSQMAAALKVMAREAGKELVREDGVDRLYDLARRETYPAGENFVVAAPAIVDEKRKPGFRAAWEAFVSADLFGGVPALAPAVP
jgi:hypothetical protein